MLMSLLLLMSVPLPGQAKPLGVWAGAPGSLYLSRAEPGGLPQLWFVSGEKALAVDLGLAADLRFLATEPGGSGLWRVGTKEMVLFRWSGGVLKETPLRRTLPRALKPNRPWFFLEWVRWGNGKALVFQEDQRVWVVPEDLQQPCLEGQLPVEAQTTHALQQTWVGTNGRVGYWTDARALYRIKPGSGTSLNVTQDPPPPLKDMERFSVLGLEGETPLWFLYGGSRGQLPSFGWRLPNGPSASGIVTRYGLDPLTSRQRLLVLTVSSSLSGQMWNVVSGGVTFQMTVLEKGPSGWRQPSQFSIKMKKDKKNKHAYTLQWDVDANRDGLADLVAADEGKGIRLFLSQKEGGFNLEPRSLGPSPEALLFLTDRYLLCSRSGSGWTLEQRSFL